MKIQTIKIQYLCEVKIHLYNGNAISVEQTKKILNDPTMSDEQAEEIRKIIADENDVEENTHYWFICNHRQSKRIS